MPLMGPEFAHVIKACAMGSLTNAPKLTISKKHSACLVAAAHGYPESSRSGDIVSIQMQTNDSLQLFHAGTRCNKEGDLMTSGGRVLSVVAQGENFDEAFSSAYKGMKQINFKGMIYRLDIGHQVRTF